MCHETGNFFPGRKSVDYLEPFVCRRLLQVARADPIVKSMLLGIEDLYFATAQSHAAYRGFRGYIQDEYPIGNRVMRRADRRVADAFPIKSFAVRLICDGAWIVPVGQGDVILIKAWQYAPVNDLSPRGDNEMHPCLGTQIQ